MVLVEMNRTDAAMLFREACGDRLITYEQWDSRIDYAAHAPHHDPFPWPPEQMVDHHHGASQQIQRLRDRVATGMSPTAAEIITAQYVEKIHLDQNGWPHGVAYCVMVGPLTGQLYEARSFWVEHGAHFNDSPRDDYAIYFMIGSNDPGPTPELIDGHIFVADILAEHYGMDRRAITDHGSVPGNSTSCAGHMRLVAQQDADGSLIPPRSPTMPDVIVTIGGKPGDDRYTTDREVRNYPWQGGDLAIVSGLDQHRADALLVAGRAPDYITTHTAHIPSWVADAARAATGDVVVVGSLVGTQAHQELEDLLT